LKDGEFSAHSHPVPVRSSTHATCPASLSSLITQAMFGEECKL